MQVERMTIWELLESCAEKLTAEGNVPFSRGDLIACVQRNNPQYGLDSINPIIQGITVNLRGGAPGAVGKNILYSVARGRFMLYRKAHGGTQKGYMPSKLPEPHSTRHVLTKSLPTGAIPKLRLEQTMFVLPCSERKAPSAGIRRGPSVTRFLPRNLARELMAQRTRNAEKTGIDESTLEPAIDRYDGTLYQTGRSAIGKLMEKGAHLLIFSGGYVVVLATEPIGMYDSRFRPSMWHDRIVERCLAAYAEEAAVTTVIGIMSGSTGYADVFRRTEWPSILSQVLLVTPERGTGAMVKAPRAQGEALVAIASSEELVDGWRSTDGLVMEVTTLATS